MPPHDDKLFDNWLSLQRETEGLLERDDYSSVTSLRRPRHRSMS